jgi:hypothetical protein
MLFEFGEGILLQHKDRVRNSEIVTHALLQRLTMPSDNRVSLRCVSYVLGHGLFFALRDFLFSRGPLRVRSECEGIFEWILSFEGIQFIAIIRLTLVH